MMNLPFNRATINAVGMQAEASRREVGGGLSAVWGSNIGGTIVDLTPAMLFGILTGERVGASYGWQRVFVSASPAGVITVEICQNQEANYGSPATLAAIEPNGDTTLVAGTVVGLFPCEQGGTWQYIIMAVGTGILQAAAGSGEGSGSGEGGGGNDGRCTGTVTSVTRLTRTECIDGAFFKFSRLETWFYNDAGCLEVDYGEEVGEEDGCCECSGSGSGSGGGGDEIIVACCGDPIPDTLYAAITSNCGLLDGNTVTLTFNGVCWEGSLTMACSCDTFAIGVCCVGTTWQVTTSIFRTAPGSPCVTTIIDDCGETATISCDPLHLTHTSTGCISQIGLENCCTNVTFTIDITETP